MTRDWRVKTGIALLLTMVAGYVAYLEVQASDDSDEIISAGAVWNPDPAMLSHIQQDCKAVRTGSSSQCFTEQMNAAGASDEAIDFVRSYAELNHGTLAILSDFHPLDAVDLGLIYFPSGNEVRHSWVLLNGTPAIVDLDNLELLPDWEMRKDSAYQSLLETSPRARILPVDPQPGISSGPVAEQLQDGGQRFTVAYPIGEGCRSCALLGQAEFSFSFDSSGDLKSIHFKSFRPSPAAHHP